MLEEQLSTGQPRIGLAVCVSGEVWAGSRNRATTFLIA